MAILLKLRDEEYPFNGIKETRIIVRAFLILDNGKYLFHHLLGDDIFGHRDYFETPGGGVEKGESLIEALKRECLEETGYEIKIKEELGVVEDYYNLIRRKNINHYFLCEAVGSPKPVHFVSKGDQIIHSTDAYSLQEIGTLYYQKASEPLARSLLNREIPFIDLLMSREKA